jgi:hypothetical protein
MLVFRDKETLVGRTAAAAVTTVAAAVAAVVLVFQVH